MADVESPPSAVEEVPQRLKPFLVAGWILFVALSLIGYTFFFFLQRVLILGQLAWYYLFSS